jgi:hypothetical protein
MDGSSKHTVFDLATRGAKQKTCEGGSDRNAAAAAGYDAQGAVGRQKAAGTAAGTLSSYSSLHRERESVRTRRDENGKNAVPKLRRAGRVGLLELTIIAKLAIIHNKI